MAEREIIRKTETVYDCEVCNNGQLVYSNSGYYPFGKKMIWDHRCNNCGVQKQLPKRYPFIVENKS